MSLMFIAVVLVTFVVKCESQSTIPIWNIPLSNRTNASYGFPLIKESHYTVYNSTSNNGSMNPNGTYNAGPIITKWNGIYYVSWHNSPQNESENMRILLSTSDNIKSSWTEPIEIFPNILPNTNQQNEPFITINNRLYASTSFGPNDNPALMRQILSPNKFGDIFWLNKTVPNGFQYLGYKTYLQMNDETIYDMHIYLSSLINAEVSNVTSTINGDFVYFTERSMYQIPSTKNQNELEIMLILRANCSTHVCNNTEYASYCNISQQNIIFNDNLFECRPGTSSLYWNLVQLAENNNNSNKSEPQNCDWTIPMKTNIPDTSSRTCSSALPNGSVYLLGNQVEDTRDVLVLSLSDDGVIFNKAWAIRYNPPPIKYPGKAKLVGFQYPGAMWDDNNLYVSYDVNKEDILISIINLNDIQ